MQCGDIISVHEFRNILEELGVVNIGKIVGFKDIKYDEGIAVVRYKGPPEDRSLEIDVCYMPELEKYQYDYIGNLFKTVEAKIKVYDRVRRVWEQPMADDDIYETTTENERIEVVQYGKVQPKPEIEGKDWIYCTRPFNRRRQ